MAHQAVFIGFCLGVRVCPGWDLVPCQPEHPDQNQSHQASCEQTEAGLFQPRGNSLHLSITFQNSNRRPPILLVPSLERVRRRIMAAGVRRRYYAGAGPARTTGVYHILYNASGSPPFAGAVGEVVVNRVPLFSLVFHRRNNLNNHVPCSCPRRAKCRRCTVYCTHVSVNKTEKGQKGYG